MPLGKETKNVKAKSDLERKAGDASLCEGPSVPNTLPFPLPGAVIRHSVSFLSHADQLHASRTCLFFRQEIAPDTNKLGKLALGQLQQSMEQSMGSDSIDFILILI